MTTPASPLPPTLLDVSDLIDSPGATREVGFDSPVPEGLEVPLTDLGEELAVDGVLESLVEGVLFRGKLISTVTTQCSLCLEPVPAAEVVIDVAEIFTDPAQVEDAADVELGYEITSDSQIDLDTMIRDAIAASMPHSPRCRENCAGLCPSCGVNLNDATCDCADEAVDDRWAKLADLQIDS